MKYTCETCGYVIDTDISISIPSDLIFRRGYWWHVPCFRENDFPSRGKMIPETIMTQEPESECWDSLPEDTESTNV